ncbi:MAG: cytochrome b/b6 domain-containing protein [Rhizobiales bacterium]|nr:cytochrome b/b6 domain-containing protein [Hyphomicrobiales bacterium]
MARVWDPLVRVFHWSLAASFAVAWFTPGDSGVLHQWAGFAAAGLVAIRVLWGFLGTPYARFSQFVRHPAEVLAYLRDIAAAREARHLGHNPAGGAMIVALLAAMAGTSFSGWMMSTDTWYGIEWVQTLHSLAANGVLVLVLVHLAGVALASFRHRENLVAGMVTGYKREHSDADN